MAETRRIVGVAQLTDEEMEIARELKRRRPGIGCFLPARTRAALAPASTRDASVSVEEGGTTDV